MSFDAPQTCPAPMQGMWQGNGVEQCMVWPMYGCSDNSPSSMQGQVLVYPMIVGCVGVVQGMMSMAPPVPEQSGLLHASPVHHQRLPCDAPAESSAAGWPSHAGFLHPNPVHPVWQSPTMSPTMSPGAASSSSPSPDSSMARGRSQLRHLEMTSINSADNRWEKMGDSGTSCGLRTPSVSPRLPAYSWQLSSEGFSSRESLCASPAPSTGGASDLEVSLMSRFGDLERMTDESFDDLVIYLEGLNATDKRFAILQLPGLIWRLASTPNGSRLLQDVLEGADAKGTAQLATGLVGRVNEAWESPSAAPHANHVLQRCVEVLPPEQCDFVLREMLQGSIERASCSKYGCRIVQRLIEHFRHEEVRPLVEEILEKDTLLKLMVSRFGNFVIQCVLEHGSEDQKQRIASAFLQQDDQRFTKLAENMYASHVVQQALKHCPEHIQWMLIDRIMRIESKDSKFKRSVYGSFVVHEAKKWLKAQGEASFPKSPPKARRGGRCRERPSEGSSSRPQQPAPSASVHDVSMARRSPGARYGVAQ